eukprot:Ihof_evm1s182 gene=Ihof_evmTU1s182
MAEEGTLIEKHFMVNILGTASRELFKRTAPQLVAVFSTSHSLPTIPSLSSLISLCAKRKGWRPCVSALIADPSSLGDDDTDTNKAINNANKKLPDVIGQILDDQSIHPSTLSWSPSFIRPIPVLLQATDHEMIWLNPSEVDFTLQWDRGVCVDTAQIEEIRALVAKAFEQALEIGQRE